MSVDTATVKRIASLARIAITDEDAARMAPELGNILGWIEMLGEVDTTGVEPMTHAIAQKNAFRADAVGESLPVETALANAPETRGNCLEVPKVIE